MSQRSVLARFLFETTAFSSAANRRTWKTVVAASAMLGAAYLADVPAVEAETEDAPAIASSPTAAVAAEVAAALGRPVRVAQAPDVVAKRKPPPAPAQGAPAPPPDVQTMQAPMPAGAQLVLMQPTLDFGNLEGGKRKTFEFVVTNTGTEPLRLDKKRVKSSCTCVTVALPRAPIAPGAKGIIKLTYTAPTRPGAASHSVIVRYVPSAATKTEASAVLSLTGVVDPRKRPRTNVKRFEGRGFILS